MDRAGLIRMRWRMRGAWMWPTFPVVTLVEALLLHALPVLGNGSATVSALLFAGFTNLVLVAVVGPLVGRLLRRRRPDLPRVVASNYAGTALLCAGLIGALAAGLTHAGAIRAQRRDQVLAADATRGWVVRNAPPDYHLRLGALTIHQLGPGYYRGCVPGPQGDRWLCLYVDTGQSPPGITRDHDTQSNAELFRPSLGP